MRFAVLPTKPLAVAKSRLAVHLRDADRSALCYAMFHDVLECLCRAQHVDAVAVVTAIILRHLARLGRGLVIQTDYARGIWAKAHGQPLAAASSPSRVKAA